MRSTRYDKLNIVTDLIQREVKELLLGLEVAKLQDELNPSFGIAELCQCRSFCLIQSKVQALFVGIELWSRVKLFDLCTG